MKNKFILSTAIMVSFLFLQCQQEWIEPTKDEIVEPNFPIEIKEWGESFASNLNCATIEAKQNQQLKNANVSLLESLNSEKNDEFNISLSEFSKKQLKILELISFARDESDSYMAFSNKLAEINAEIYKTVPKSEQAKLFYITSALYHGLKEINNLVRDRVLPGNYEGEEVTLSSIVRLKSGGIEDNPDEGSWWNNPETFATIWALALAEPTPIGEAVALVVTGIVGSYLIITRAECINNYVDCKLYTSNPNCASCLQYCIVQGEWNCN